VCDRPRLVCLEGTHDLEGWGKNADNAIEAAEKEAFRAGADAADLVALKERLALIVRGVDLADLEEIECFPLYGDAYLAAASKGGIGLERGCRKGSSPKLMPWPF